MFLKSLELTGFKSFAKRTVLKFEPGITGVVGPNGSGKSNIADAVRWVLGAQSKKAVRGKISTDVIFSGTDKKPAMSLAEVALTFDNTSSAGGGPSKHRLPYDFEEVVVTRRLYRSGDSEYLVNGSKVRLLDLQHAFAVAGIGAENYTVISQGMVDKVLTQSPRERRSLFEEAAGVRQFFLKRDEARRKLSETETNLGRIEDVLRELSPRLKSLRRQAETLAKREEVEKALKEAQLAHFGHRYRDLSKSHGEAKGKQNEVSKEFSKLGNELKELTEEVDKLRKSQQGLTLNKLLSERNELRDNGEKLQEQLNKATTDKEVAKTTRERAQGQVSQLKDRLEHLATAEESTGEGSVAVESSAITALVEKLKELENAIGAKASTEKLTELATAATKLAQGMRQGGERSAGFKREQDLLTEQLSTLTSELEEIESTIKGADTELAGLTNQRKELDASRGALERKISAEQQKSFGETDELTKKEEALRAKQRTHDNYRNELSEFNLELAKLETRLDDLTNEAKGKLGDNFPPATDLELPSADKGSEEQIAKLEKRLLEMGGIDPEVTAEHKEVEERHLFLSTQGEDLKKAKSDLDKVIKELEQKSQTLFTEAFEKINKEFGEFFVKLFGGGRAELKLVNLAQEEVTDEDAPKPKTNQAPEYGVEIKAVPPGKRLKNLAQLSGGERTLTSNALLFAILTVNPSPFVLLDEVDAALDEANTGRFATTLSELGGNTQFVVVTHNRDTMRAAAMLYGVSMDSTGVSTMLSLKLPEAEKAVEGLKKAKKSKKVEA